MKKTLLLILAVLTATLGRSQDSIDVLHYDIALDLGHQMTKQVSGYTTMDIKMLRAVPQLELSLFANAVDTVWVNGVAVDSTFDGSKFSVNTSAISAGDTFTVRVKYRSGGHVESYGLGGLHMDNSLYYNLGVAFYESPHGYGRCLFPSRDNFDDKATYRMTFTSQPGWNTLGSGLLESSTENGDGSTTTVWVQDNPTPTYLISFASAPMNILEKNFQGLYGSYPALIGYTQNISNVERVFSVIDPVLTEYERCFGPYRWGRIGYVSTPKGSMESVCNIALTSSLLSENLGSGQIIASHELAHSWFGNLLTCATIGDMWINEGGASFCEEIATAAYRGADSADRYYQTRIDEVVREAHMEGYDWLSVYNPPDNLSYGMTVYYKGALVWHTIRGYLGDSLFYAVMQRLFDQHAFEAMSSEQLRDTMSAYSGVDLTDLFDFHVFGRGFVDYHIDAFTPENLGATVRISQRLTGTEEGPRSHWVPLSFISERLEVYTTRMTFSGESGEQHFDLPFTPAYVFVDMNHELSDAVADGFLQPSNLQKLPFVHFKSTLTAPSEPPYLRVSHHYGKPDADTLTGVVRCANRYWMIEGRMPADADLKGQFYFSLGFARTPAMPYIDNGFIYRNTRDSLRVVYRHNNNDPWKILRTELNANNIEGYCISEHLQPGEYTLAVVDTALAGIASIDSGNQSKLTLTPNPNQHSFKVRIAGTEGPFTLRVTDINGRCVIERENVVDGDEICHQLAKGNYIVTIQNKFLSLQSQMIVR